MISGIVLRRRHLAAMLFALWVSTAAAAGADTKPTVLVLGDSLSAEYGLARDTGWVKLLADRLAASGAQYNVVNASVSGETTSGGRTRLPRLLEQHRPAIVIIELGGNDGLRGLPLAAMRANLRAMIEAAKNGGAAVLLIGVPIPPNYGRPYADGFQNVFVSVARDTNVALVPSLLDGFAAQAEYFQPDRIHPNGRAQQRMLDNVWPHLQPLLTARARG